jgi:uncharacterized DUF497 family protein
MLEKRIVWDEKKNKINQTKHQISFEDAATVFFDSLALTVDDPEHSDYEFRFVTIGEMRNQKMIKVFYTETDEEIRIISARKPTKTVKITV